MSTGVTGDLNHGSSLRVVDLGSRTRSSGPLGLGSGEISEGENLEKEKAVGLVLGHIPRVSGLLVSQSRI